MILNETEVTERMSSPLNLLNRLRRASPDKSIVSIPPTSKEIIDDLEDKLKFGSIKSKAANIMIEAMDELRLRLPEVQKPDQLARIAESMSKVVNTETVNNDKNKSERVQFVMYAPEFHNENHYETIYSRE